MSPLRSKAKLPRMPSRTRIECSARMTEARVPSERAIACRTTSAAWAACNAYKPRRRCAEAGDEALGRPASATRRPADVRRGHVDAARLTAGERPGGR